MRLKSSANGILVACSGNNGRDSQKTKCGQNRTLNILWEPGIKLKP